MKNIKFPVDEEAPDKPIKPTKPQGTGNEG